MKKSELRQLIKEELENTLQEEVNEPIDEIGKFFIVEKPNANSTKDDIMKEVTVFDEINKESIIGVYKQKSDANRYAVEAVKNFETQLKELESAMDEFRSSKGELEEKRKKAKEFAYKLKK
jgi:hypothetical protein